MISEEELRRELELLTDIDVDKIFVGYDKVVASHSRLVCDVERFLDDEQEAMSKIGMGAVYTRTCSGKELRKSGAEQRREIIENLYIPYHKQLEHLVSSKLNAYGKCLIIDCHSNNENLPFITDVNADICIGVDEYHTQDGTWKLLFSLLTAKGNKVSVNTPFSGSIVPLEFYRKDIRVNSIMIEINKRIYRHAEETDMNKVTQLADMFSGILPELEKTI